MNNHRGQKLHIHLWVSVYCFRETSHLDSKDAHGKCRAQMVSGCLYISVCADGWAGTIILSQLIAVIQPQPFVCLLRIRMHSGQRT